MNLVILLSFIILRSASSVYYVGGVNPTGLNCGSDLQSCGLAEAINKTSDVDTVIILPGIYKDFNDINISTSITIIGMSQNGVVVEGFSRFIIGSDAKNVSICNLTSFNSVREFVVIQDGYFSLVDINFTTPSTNLLVRVEKSTMVSFERCTFENFNHKEIVSFESVGNTEFEMKSCLIESSSPQLILKGLSSIFIKSTIFSNMIDLTSPIFKFDDLEEAVVVVDNLTIINSELSNILTEYHLIEHEEGSQIHNFSVFNSFFNGITGTLFYLKNITNFEMSNCDFSDFNPEHSLQYGAIRTFNVEKTIIKDCSFRNVNGLTGGVLYSEDCGEVEVDNSEFLECSNSSEVLFSISTCDNNTGIFKVSNSYLIDSTGVFRTWDFFLFENLVSVELVDNTIIDSFFYKYQSQNDMKTKPFIKFERILSVSILGGTYSTFYNYSTTKNPRGIGVIESSSDEESPIFNKNITISGTGFRGIKLDLKSFLRLNISSCDFLGAVMVNVIGLNDYEREPFFVSKAEISDLSFSSNINNVALDYVLNLERTDFFVTSLYASEEEILSPLMWGFIRIMMTYSMSGIIEELHVDHMNFTHDPFLYLETEELWDAEVLIKREFELRSSSFTNIGAVVKVGSVKLFDLKPNKCDENEKYRFKEFLLENITFDYSLALDDTVDPSVAAITGEYSENCIFCISASTLYSEYYSTYSMTFSDSNFRNVENLYGYGGVIKNDAAPLFIVQSTFENCNAFKGSFIFSERGEIVVDKCTFSDSVVSSNLETGSIHLVNSRLELGYRSFTGKNAITSFRNSIGSCVFLFMSEVVVHPSTQFTNCKSSYYGGAISFLSFTEDLAFEKYSDDYRTVSGRFYNCSSELGGGAISFRYDYINPVLPRVNFELHGDEGNYMSSHIKGCSSTSGGGIYLQNAELLFIRDFSSSEERDVVLIEDCEADYGGVFFLNSGNLLFGDQTFDPDFTEEIILGSGNRANVGGGFAFDKGVMEDRDIGEISCDSSRWICQEEALNGLSQRKAFLNFTDLFFGVDNDLYGSFSGRNRSSYFTIGGNGTTEGYGPMFATEPISIEYITGEIDKSAVVFGGEAIQFDFLVRDAYGQRVSFYSEISVELQRYYIEVIFEGSVFESQISSTSLSTLGLVQFKGMSLSKFTSSGKASANVEIVAFLKYAGSEFVASSSLYIPFRVVNCPRGYEKEYKQIETQSSKFGDDQTTVVETAVNCVRCSVGWYNMREDQNKCFECPENADCSDPSIVVSDKDYWSYVKSDGEVKVLFCPNGKCEGGNECKGYFDSDEPLCSSCIEGYSEWNGECVQCEGFTFARFVVIVLSVAFLLFTVFSIHRNSQDLESSVERIFSFFGNTYKHILRNISFSELNALLVPVLSLLTAFQIPVQNDPPVPDSNAGFIDYVNLLLYPFTYVVSQIFRCPYDRSSFQVLWMNLLDPLIFTMIIVFLLILCYFYKCCRKGTFTTGLFTLLGIRKTKDILERKKKLARTTSDNESSSDEVVHESDEEIGKYSESDEEIQDISISEESETEEEESEESSEENEGGVEEESSENSSEFEQKMDEEKSEEEEEEEEKELKMKGNNEEENKEEKVDIKGSPFEYWKKLYKEEMEIRREAASFFDICCIITGCSIAYPFIKRICTRVRDSRKEEDGGDDDDDDDDDDDISTKRKIGRKIQKILNIESVQFAEPWYVEIIPLMSFICVGLPSWFICKLILVFLKSIDELLFHISSYQRTILNLTIITYQLILENGLSYINCVEYGDEYRMIKYSDIKCYITGTYWTNFVFLCLIPLIYCALYPLVILFLLFSQKRYLYDSARPTSEELSSEEEGEDDEEKKQQSSASKKNIFVQTKIGCFYLCYRKGCWWYEVFSVYRKFLIVSLIVLSQNIPELSDYFLSIVLGFSLFLHIFLRPYRKCFDNVLEGLSLGCLCILQLIRTSSIYINEKEYYRVIALVSILVTFIPIFVILTYLKFRISLIFILAKIEKLVVKKCIVSCCICCFPFCWCFDYCCCYDDESCFTGFSGERRRRGGGGGEMKDERKSLLNNYVGSTNEEDVDDEGAKEKELEDFMEYGEQENIQNLDFVEDVLYEEEENLEVRGIGEDDDDSSDKED